MRLVVRLLINALALWLTTLFLAPHVAVLPFSPGGTLETVLTYLLLAVIFGVVNGVVGGVIRVVAFPLYILTLGLFALLVNGLLLLIVSWISGFLQFGLVVDGFWWGVAGALVLGIISWLLGIVLRPVIGNSKSR